MGFSREAAPLLEFGYILVVDALLAVVPFVRASRGLSDSCLASSFRRRFLRRTPERE